MSRRLQRTSSPEGHRQSGDSSFSGLQTSVASYDPPRTGERRLGLRQDAWDRDCSARAAGFEMFGEVLSDTAELVATVGNRLACEAMALGLRVR